VYKRQGMFEGDPPQGPTNMSSMVCKQGIHE